jgi:hypothetical protein
MDTFLLIAVVLSASLLIVSGVWVGTAMIAETLRLRRLARDRSSSDATRME